MTFDSKVVKTVICPEGNWEILTRVFSVCVRACGRVEDDLVLNTPSDVVTL